MSKLSGGASYLSKESVPAKRLSTPKKSPVNVAISAFFALLILFMSVQPLLTSLSGSSSPQKAEAGSIGLFCATDIGLWMDDKMDWGGFLKFSPLPDEKNRTWTLQEAFGHGATFVNYEGEGGKDKDLVVEKSPANDFKPGNYDTLTDKLEETRTFESCVIAGAATTVANIVLFGASSTANVVQMFVVFAFDSNIICEDPANPSGFCLNLLKVIGGTSGDTSGGLIGTLTGSIYMPLLVVAVTITGLWVGYKGLVQRKLREAMFGAIWVCLSVIIGLALLLNPSLLAKAPMAVSNAVATCVIGSFNGDNCMDNTSGTTSLKTDNFTTSSSQICKSVAPGATLDAQMSMTVNSLSCSIWRAFVLEPYAQGSFGTSFENLDTVADTPTKKVIEKAGLDPNTFCVNLGSSGSLASFYGKQAVFDRDTGKICNLLAYQMFLKTNASTSGSATPAAGEIDSRWYNVVVASANDEGLWAHWAPSSTSGMHKIASATLAVATTLIGGFILIVIAFFALVYYLTSVILMAFAPLFFLLGVHPGRGKKILLGWFEKVVSNVLKYLASAIFLIVSVTFYAAILGAASNPALTFLFVIIVSGALFMYRKEIIELVGKTSMGGEQLSSKFSDSLAERAKGVGGLALAGAGSGLGAKIAGGRVSSGIKAGIQRDLQRGGAKKIFGNVGGELVSNATRQFARNNVDNERDIKNKANEAQAEQAAVAQELTSVATEQEAAVTEARAFDITFNENRSDLDTLNTAKDAKTAIEDEAAREMSAENPYFAQAQLLFNQIAALKFEKDLALNAGDTATADQKIAQIEALSGQREILLGAIDSDELARNREEYEGRVEEKMFRAGLEYTDVDESTRYQLSTVIASAQATRDDLVERANSLSERRNELEISSASLTAKKDTLNREFADIQPGDTITKAKADAILARGDKAAFDAAMAAPVSPALLEHRRVDDVYDEHRFGSNRPDNGLPPYDPSGPNDGDSDPNGSGSGPTSPSPFQPTPHDSNPEMGPTPTPTPTTPTTPIPTTPPGDNNPTDRIPTQPERAPGAPVQPERAPGVPVQPERSSGIPTQPDQAPSARPLSDTERRDAWMVEMGLVRAQPTQQVTPAEAPSGNPSANLGVADESYNGMATPFPQPSPTGLPTSQGRRAAQAVNESNVPTQPDRAPMAPTQPEYAPQVPAQPVSAPYAPPQPNRDPQVQASSAQPERMQSAPAQPDRTPSIPTQPAYSPTVPAQPMQAPSAPVQAAPTPVTSESRNESPRVEAARAETPSPQSIPVVTPVAVTAPAPTPVTVAPEASRPSGRRAEGVPAQPAQAPRIPTQPQNAPTAPAVQQDSRVQEPRVEAPRPQAASAPAPVVAPTPASVQPERSTPAQPVQSPRIPTQPQSAPASAATPVAVPAPAAPVAQPEQRRQESRVETPRPQAAPAPAPVVAPAPAPSQPERPAPSPTPAPEPRRQETRVEAPRPAPAQPVQAPVVPAQPQSAPTVPAEPRRSEPRVETPRSQAAPAPAPVVAPAPAPAQPERPAPAPEPRRQETRVEAPRPQAVPAPAPVQPERPAPAQPVQSPRVPTQPQSAPAPTPAPEPRVEAPRPQATPAPAPRPVPEQPVQAPRIPAQPQSAPVAPTRSATAAQPEPRRQEARVETPRPQAAPPAPAREPAVPSRPEREPRAPMVRDSGERQAPLAREIRLPAAPQVSRITENSEIPSVSVNREDQGDNGPRRGFGLPRRRNSGND